jgi:hypothetical protein
MTSPRLGTTILLPGVNWILRGFWGKFYQAPPLTTLSGPLLQYAQASNLGFLPLRGERDEEYQFGVTIPVQGWTVDIDHFHTEAKNFFDHNPIGNSNVFLPLTINGALIQGNELSIRSPRFWSVGQAHVTCSNQTADGYGTINGGLTDFNPPPGILRSIMINEIRQMSDWMRICRPPPMPPSMCTTAPAVRMAKARRAIYRVMPKSI